MKRNRLNNHLPHEKKTRHTHTNVHEYHLSVTFSRFRLPCNMLSDGSTRRAPPQSRTTLHAQNNNSTIALQQTTFE